MRGINRSGRSRGAVRGHQFGAGGDPLLGYRDARHAIDPPGYRWVLKHRPADEVGHRRALLAGRTVVVLDHEMNGDVDDPSAPLSHAALMKCHMEGNWPLGAGYG